MVFGGRQNDLVSMLVPGYGGYVPRSGEREYEAGVLEEKKNAQEAGGARGFQEGGARGGGAAASSPVAGYVYAKLAQKSSVAAISISATVPEQALPPREPVNFRPGSAAALRRKWVEESLNPPAGDRDANPEKRQEFLLPSDGYLSTKKTAPSATVVGREVFRRKRSGAARRRSALRRRAGRGASSNRSSARSKSSRGLGKSVRSRSRARSEAQPDHKNRVGSEDFYRKMAKLHGTTIKERRAETRERRLAKRQYPFKHGGKENVGSPSRNKSSRSKSACRTKVQVTKRLRKPLRQLQVGVYPLHRVPFTKKEQREAEAEAARAAAAERRSADMPRAAKDFQSADPFLQTLMQMAGAWDGFVEDVSAARGSVRPMKGPHKLEGGVGEGTPRSSPGRGAGRGRSGARERGGADEDAGRDESMSRTPSSPTKSHRRSPVFSFYDEGSTMIPGSAVREETLDDFLSDTDDDEFPGPGYYDPQERKKPRGGAWSAGRVGRIFGDVEVVGVGKQADDGAPSTDFRSFVGDHFIRQVSRHLLQSVACAWR